MIVLAALLFAAAVVFLALAVGLIAPPNRAVRSRIKTLAGRDQPATAQEDHRLAQDRPADSAILARLTPQSMMDRIAKNLVYAGHPEGWSRERIVVMKPAGLIAGLLFALFVLTQAQNPVVILFGLAMPVLGYFLPDLLIYNQAIKRQQRIQLDLPDTLDQIVISIEAGIGFEAALRRTAENGEGPLAEELGRLIQDIGLGLSRREAYLALAERTSVEELRSFARAIVQAEEYGMSVVAVVRSQAAEMRVGRRARAEEKAQKVPVTILLPLMTCILPVLFVIVLGPAVVTAFVINS